MDSLTLKRLPILSSFYFTNNNNNFTCPKTKPFSSSFYHLSYYYRTHSNTVPVCLSCSNKSSSSSNSDPRRPKDWNFSTNPLLVLVPAVLGSVEKFALLHSKKWVSRLQACSEESLKAMCGQNRNYLQNGAFGLALLSVTASARVKISPFMATLAANPTFLSGLFSWFFAQATKVLLNFFVERKWDFRILFASGGMPSSHSALCTAMTASVALCHGVADSLFPVCLGFSLIVMYDAIGVRRHAGMQAEVLNVILQDLFQGHPISQRKLKELLGHTPSQVLAGAVLGILVACVCCHGCLVAT